MIPLQRQLEYFREYKVRLTAKLGVRRAQEIINNAVYLVSAGTNDFVVNYFTLPVRRQEFSLPSYMDFLMNKELEFLQVCFCYSTITTHAFNHANNNNFLNNNQVCRFKICPPLLHFTKFDSRLLSCSYTYI